MSRPKSSWAEIIGAVGALSAAEGAGRAAAGAHDAAEELRSLRASHVRLSVTLQEHIVREEQHRAAEERQRERVRKLKQAAFDFSEALVGLKGDIEGLLPDYYCAAALLKEKEPQRHANALWEEREWLESYEDKKLVKNCLDTINTIRASIEKYAASDGITFDQLAATLSSRQSRIGLWRTLSSDARKAIEELSRAVGDWTEKGPGDFLDALQELRNATASTRAAMNTFANERSQFSDAFDFVADHPDICQIWHDATESSPGKAESILSGGRTLLAQADQLLGTWTSQVEAFEVLKDLFSRAEYEDFLENLKESTPQVAQLQEVMRLANTAKERSEKVTSLIRTAREQIHSKSWHRALAILREAKLVPAGQRLRTELRGLQVTALKGTLPARLAWIAATGITALGLGNWFGMPGWFLLVVALIPTILTVVLLVQIVAKMRG